MLDWLDVGDDESSAAGVVTPEETLVATPCTWSWPPGSDRKLSTAWSLYLGKSDARSEEVGVATWPGSWSRISCNVSSSAESTGKSSGIFEKVGFGDRLELLAGISCDV